MAKKTPHKPKKAAKKPGPAPEFFKIDEPLTFEEAVKRATLKKKPAGGWPKLP